MPAEERSGASARDSCEGVRQVLDQIVGVFEADVQAHQIVGGRFRDSADRMDRQSESFIAAPAEADPEQIETLDKGRGVAVELEREQPRRAFEVALPEIVTR